MVFLRFVRAIKDESVLTYYRDAVTIKVDFYGQHQKWQLSLLPLFSHQLSD